MIDEERDEAIPFANIVTYRDSVFQSFSTFAQTDTSGLFSILEKNTEFWMIVSCLGYHSDTLYSADILTNRPLKLIIALKRATSNLAQIKVVADRNRAIIKGDTLTYSVRDYAAIEEVDLRDVLLEIPGITVDDSGRLSYGGEEISELLVDGKPQGEQLRRAVMSSLEGRHLSTIDILKDYKGEDEIDSLQTGGIAINVNVKSAFQKKPTGNLEAYLAGNSIFDGSISGKIVNIGNNQFIMRGFASNVESGQLSLTDYFAINPSAATGSNSSIPKIFLPNNNWSEVDRKYITGGGTFLAGKQTFRLSSTLFSTDDTRISELSQNFFNGDLLRERNRLMDNSKGATIVGDATIVSNKKQYLKLSSSATFLAQEGNLLSATTGLATTSGSEKECNTYSLITTAGTYRRRIGSKYHVKFNPRIKWVKSTDDFTLSTSSPGPIFSFLNVNDTVVEQTRQSTFTAYELVSEFAYRASVNSNLTIKGNHKSSPVNLNLEGIGDVSNQLLQRSASSLTLGLQHDKQRLSYEVFTGLNILKFTDQLANTSAPVKIAPIFKSEVKFTPNSTTSLKFTLDHEQKFLEPLFVLGENIVESQVSVKRDVDKVDDILSNSRLRIFYHRNLSGGSGFMLFSADVRHGDIDLFLFENMSEVIIRQRVILAHATRAMFAGLIDRKLGKHRYQATLLASFTRQPQIIVGEITTTNRIYQTRGRIQYDFNISKQLNFDTDVDTRLSMRESSIVTTIDAKADINLTILNQRASIHAIAAYYSQSANATPNVSLTTFQGQLKYAIGKSKKYFLSFRYINGTPFGNFRKTAQITETSLNMTTDLVLASRFLLGGQIKF